MMKEQLDHTSTDQLHALMARAILDKNIFIEIKGNNSRAIAARAVLEASRELFNFLGQPNVSLIEIREALDRKHYAAAHYQKIFNESWCF